jgi:hypothetical protein
MGDRTIEYRKAVETCDDVKLFPSVIIFSPTDSKKIQQFQACFPQAQLVTGRTDGIHIFSWLEISSL